LALSSRIECSRHGCPSQSLRQRHLGDHPPGGRGRHPLLRLPFIVKPVLHTSEEAFHSSGLDQIGKTLNTVNVQVQRQIRRSFKVTKSQGGNPQRLIKCVKHAHQDVGKIERCTRRF
jgi:hypothetical protein